MLARTWLVSLKGRPVSLGTHLPHPLGHDVGAGRAVVGVDNDDGDDDGRDDGHHGEQHVLPDQRHGTGGGRDQLHDDQEEHSEGQQDRDTQSHLLPWRDTRKKCKARPLLEPQDFRGDCIWISIKKIIIAKREWGSDRCHRKGDFGHRRVQEDHVRTRRRCPCQDRRLASE